MVERKRYSGVIGAQDARKDGVCCTECGCRDSRVGKTEHVGECIKRIRYCRNCGTVLHTVEAFAWANPRHKKLTNQTKGE